MKAPTSSLFRQTLSRFTTGVSILAGKAENEQQGVTINSLASVSLDPPLVLFCLKKESPRYAFFSRCKEYAISVLSDDQKSVADYFARNSQLKEAPFPIKSKNEVPLIPGALAHLKGQWQVSYDGGDHTIFVLRVTHLAFEEHKKPLLFYASQYRLLQEAS